MKMNKNKTVRISAILLGASVVLSGCIKETFPESGYATTDQVADSFSLENITAPIPSKLITSYIDVGDHFDFGYPGIMGATDRLAGEVFPVSQNLPGGNQYYDRWQGYLYPANSTGLSASGYCAPFFYLNYYKFIKEANDVISLVSGSEDDDAKAAYGVAKAFRASFYLDLARLYDALPAKAPNRPAYESEVLAVAGLTVPIVTETTPSETLRNNPRVPREDMFEFIFNDLDEAESCLAEYVPKSKSYPTLAVVYGLKARAYLWLGGFSENYEKVPTGNDAYKKAAEYARKAIDASGCTIMTESQWTDKLTGFNTVNSSWMWAMIQTTDTVLNNLLSWTAHMSPDAIWGYGYGAQPGISVFSYNRISDSDFRKKVFVGPDRSYEAMKNYTYLTEAEFETIAPCASFKFHTGGGEKTNYSVGNVTSIPLMRVEEMYLIEAEATAHYDNGTASTLIQSFMSTRDSGYDISQAGDLVDEILFQKRIEFWGEGIVFYDMKRLNVSMQNGKSGTNAPSMAKISTEGRAPWWNCVFPQSSAQKNTALLNNNNPDPCKTVLETTEE